MMDNRIFNVNGCGKDHLALTLCLAFAQDFGSGSRMSKGYVIHPQKGMILLWSGSKDAVPFPCALSAEAAAEIVWQWLSSEPGTECKGWDADYDHDGHNSLGWRVYCEDWGHVGHNHNAIVAVKPVYLWHGKLVRKVIEEILREKTS
jgi:hypothetical protein